MTIAGEILVTHGRIAALTRCPPYADGRPERGERVVLRSARGVELGDVLGETEHGIAVSHLTAGEILRRATQEDEALARQLHERSLTLLDDAQAAIAAESLPLLALDAEFLLDGNEAFVQVVQWGKCTLTPLVEALQSRHGVRVRLLNHGGEAADDHGCSSCGADGCGACGTGGCGESGCGGGGSCSRDSFRTAEDLTRYFRELRETMLAHPKVPLL